MKEIWKVRLFRMTHIDNIEYIAQNGITHKSSISKNSNYRNIGDLSLISIRNNKTVFVNNGEYEKDKSKQIVLGDYTPFYFGFKMPMLYVIQMGGNNIQEPTPEEEIVYVVLSLVKVLNECDDWYFSDGHAIDALTSFYDKSKVEELPQIIDWKAVETEYWGGGGNLDVKRRKQAEFLVKGDISTDSILGYICYNETARNKLCSLGIDEAKIKNIPSFYFSRSRND